MANSHLTDGEVRKIDKGAGKLTLKHAEIKSLEMPGMMMVFAVKDKAMLEKLQPGDKIRFAVVDDGGTFTVTAIEMAK
jgi:Cu(I)/Ag(I) efflux system periplasmic protein CusF